MAGGRGPALVAALAVVLVLLGACRGMLPPEPVGPSPSPAGLASPEPTADAPATAVPDPDGSANPDESGAPVGLLPTCDGLPLLAAPAEWYRPETRWPDNLEDVRAWARRQPAFESVWIDRDRHGWISVGFSADAEDRQADILEAFPEGGVVAVALPYSERELNRLRRRAIDGIGGVTGHGISLERGVVRISIGVLEPERVREISLAFHGEPLCLDGIPPEAVPPQGPQPAGGEGWRLLALASEQAGLQLWRTGIAWDQASFDALWAEAGLAQPPAAVDFGAEVAIWFGAVGSPGCQPRLDGIVVDDSRGLVHGDFVNPSILPCAAVAAPITFMVAFERDRLPAAPFAIQLGAAPPPPGAPAERTVVEADLRAPGSVAAPGQVHGDPGQAFPGGEVLEPGATVAPGFPRLFRFPVACGVEWLGPLNATWWRTSDPDAADGGVPDAWADEVIDGEVTGTIVVGAVPRTLEVEVASRTVDYVPTEDEPPACP